MKKYHRISFAVALLSSLVFLIILINQKWINAMNDKTTLSNTAPFQNRLAGEKSPYLLQHADNPVNWYPWSEEAFEKARGQNKPIFLSIGYSTCHWCHVMEHESFEDPDVAALMNDAFVSIKVDREERPDLDNIYMTVCRIMTRGGGWPLTIIMTPDKKPFFAATYIPKNNRYGRMGMMELIPRIKEAWRTNRDELLNSADQVADALKQSVIQSPGGEPGEPILRSAYDQFERSFDEKNGGFGNAPKFPTPHNFLFLLRYWKRSGDAMTLKMVEETLQAMRRGGIYDHVGFGFHRYSTDAEWLLPHFEKMLYDQALLAMAYIETYQATGKREYADTAREIFTYVMRDMTDPGGGFYSAEDADSEGEEGKFYLWTEDEIKEVLDDYESQLIITYFNVHESGNFTDRVADRKTGNNILHLKNSWLEISSSHELSEEQLKYRAELALDKLFYAREKRIHPYKDDKILTDWNGLMMAALAQGARVLDEPKYAEAAARAAGFILDNMRDSGGRLLHRYRNGEAGIMGNVEDYSFLIWGLIELYETTFDVGFLKTALSLNDDLVTHFWDDENGGFFFTPDDGERLLIRQKEIYDGAIPSGNSVAAYNLIRLSRITANSGLEDMTSRTGEFFSSDINRTPWAFTMFLLAVDFDVGPSYEVVIAGGLDADDTKDMIRALNTEFLPKKIVIFRPDGHEIPEIVKLSSYTETQTAIDGKATAYVCRNFACNLPTTNIEKMLKLIGE